MARRVTVTVTCCHDDMAMITHCTGNQSILISCYQRLLSRPPSVCVVDLTLIQQPTTAQVRRSRLTTWLGMVVFAQALKIDLFTSEYRLKRTSTGRETLHQTAVNILAHVQFKLRRDHRRCRYCGVCSCSCTLNPSKVETSSSCLGRTLIV